MRATLSILLFAAACGGREPPAAVPAAEPASLEGEPRPASEPVATPGSSKPVTHRSLVSIGLDPSTLDRQVDPCDDFYQFACGGWIKQTEIAADHAEAMRSVVDIADRNLEYAHGLLEQVSRQPGSDPGARQLATYYRSCMDEPAIDKAGLAALRPQLAQIARITDARSLTAALAALHAGGVDAVFALSPAQDAADARRVIASLDQAELGLPGRDDYLRTDDEASGRRATYQAYVESLLAAIGHAGARQEAADVVALETALARLARDPRAPRDPHAPASKLARAAIARLAPRLDWDAYWAGVGLGAIKDVAVSSPGLLAGIDQLVAATPPATWRAYLAAALTSATAPVLTRPLEELQFAFAAALTGQPELPPRWKRCVQHTERALGDLIGQAFVHDKLGGASQALADQQLHAIAGALAASLDDLPWMDAATRTRARAKLDAMSYQVGAPRSWRSYALKLDARTWAANAIAARRAARARQLASIGKPLDPDDWPLAASQVSAAYDPRRNTLVIPAGILQPPLYSVESSIPVNLGGIGVVIGHELTHGFDDQGAQYDAAGNLARWWQADTERAFQQRARCVVDQYSDYEVTGGGKLDGAHTAGENIADIGGIKLAFAAYRALRAPAPDTVLADGFTEDQQFFLGFGQARCGKIRPELEKLRAATDLHTPASWRVNGALSATPAFAQAFGCKPGAKMRPAQQCVVW